MYYLHHVHPASASSQSVYLDTFLPSGPCLCRVLHTSLSFIALSSESASSSSSSAVNPLSEILSVPINARILRVAAVTPQEAGGAQRLAVLTDHHQPRLIILVYRPVEQQQCDGKAAWSPIQTEAVLLLDEMGRPAAESGLTVEVEQGPGAAYIYSHTHAGILKVAPLSPSIPRVGSAASTSSKNKTDLDRAFGVRLPHPHLISSTFLARRSISSPSSLALLSLSSVASRIPGLGMQCLPVLSFHTIDEEHQALAPSPWGPPRKVPPLASTKEASTSPTRSRRKSSASQASQNQSSRSDLQEMPGSFSTASQEETPTSSQASAVKSKRHGAAALGATRTAEEEEKYEKDLAEEPLTRAHVPLPFADALGAHLLLSLPVRAGGGVLVFCETSILHVSCPNADIVKSPISPKASSSIPGKRRKASTGQTNVSTVPRRTSGASFAAAISTSPTSPTLTTSLPPNRSNENGKRRRSTAGSQTQAIIAGRESTSPTTQRRSSALPSWMSRILRLEMGKPVIVASATVVSEPGNTADDGVQIDSVDQGKASLQVLFATHSGTLYLLTISLERAEDGEGDPWRPFDMVVQLLGTTPAPGSNGALTYLGENFISIASTGGDSVIVQIQSDIAADPEGDVEMDKQPSIHTTYSLKTIHQWTNLAPILDFVVDDGAGGDASDAKSAQARVITCSGTGPTGSLRIIRNGVILEDVLSIAEDQVTRVWSIAGGSLSETKLLVLGYHTHSRVLSIEACCSEFQDISSNLSAAGLNLSAPILEAISLNDGHFVIVQPSGVTVWSADRLQQVSSWMPASLDLSSLQRATISKASANQTGQILLSMQTHVVLLQVDAQGIIQVVRLEDVRSEVSALDVSSLQKGKQAQYAAIALWNPWIIKIFSLASWEDVTPSALNSPQPSLIRSVLLHTFNTRGVATSEPHLLLGLGDGTLNSYGLSLPFADSLVKRVGILEKRSASMGSQPLHLRSFETAEGLDAIFVSCDRPSVVYSYGKGLQYSSVPHREVNDVCQVQIQDEVMVLFAKSRQLVLSKMGQIQKLDVSTIELGANNPISLTMCPEARAVAAVTHTFLPEGRLHAAEQVGKVMLYDYEDFEQLDEYDLEVEERPNCIESMDIMGRKLVIVGTGYTFPDRSETMSGRLLIFSVSQRKLKLVASHNVEGNTYAVGKVQDYVVACINSKVITYEVEEEDNSGSKGTDISLKLLQVGEWACAFTAITLRNVGSAKLVIGDALRSLVILKIDGDSGKIEEVARDCDPYWTMAAEVLDEDEEEYLGCDIGFNLWTCSRVKWTESAKRQIQRSRARNMETGMMASQNIVQTEDAIWSHIMQRQAAYHYGDLINVMKKGALTAQGNNNSTGSKNTSGSGGVEPRIVFGTAAGAIGIVAKVDDDQAKVLSQLELNLRETFEPIGRITAEEWRTLRTDHRTQKSAGFIDGDFVNTTYESLSTQKRSSLLNSGPIQVEAEPDAINSLIESLNRLS